MRVRVDCPLESQNVTDEDDEDDERKSLGEREERKNLSRWWNT